MKTKIFLICLSCLGFVTGCADINDSFKPLNPLAGATSTEDGVEVLNSDIDFQLIKTVILDDNCINCHTGKHRNYDQYTIVRSFALKIVDRITTNSFLDRMPAGRARLDDELIQLFKDWVSLGAPEFVGDAPDPIIEETELNPELNGEFLRPFQR